MNTNPLTPAALGLKIGLLLCLLVGCQSAPEPEQVIDEPQAVEQSAPEKSVIVPMATKAEVDALDRQMKDSVIRIRRLEALEKALSGWMDRLNTRTAKLENEPKCCMIPTVSADKPSVPAPSEHKSPEVFTTHRILSGNLIDDAEQGSIDDGEKLIFLLTKDGCSRCEAFKSSVIGNGNTFFSLIGKLHFQEVNTSRHPEAAARFDIPAGTLLPVALVWNPATQTFHQIPADPNDPIEFLAKLTSFQSDAAPPRKRLLNFRKD